MTIHSRGGEFYQKSCGFFRELTSIFKSVTNSVWTNVVSAIKSKTAKHVAASLAIMNYVYQCITLLKP